ncbi:DUF983 domain-containing protein [Pseudolabrys taiwanensis]|uniref:DUF983 domain-containing protein n=1 Tax=Pseudolabrys taiwanensis TaxID=331696 RepID=A0A345ZY67_9HYPH|nr:DUF983 domain-containing protein [Pseudolabrys taiwanensis]
MNELPFTPAKSAAKPAAIRPPKGAGEAMWRGFLGKCPACGEGKMFRKYLKVADNCPNCGEELYHHRADDFPAYLVIVIVGHILVPIVLAVETDLAPPIWLSMTLWPAIALISTLALLQPTKGAVVAIQWFAGMHGFETSKGRRLPRPAIEPVPLH